MARAAAPMFNGFRGATSTTQSGFTGVLQNNFPRRRRESGALAGTGARYNPTHASSARGCPDCAGPAPVRRDQGFHELHADRRDGETGGGGDVDDRGGRKNSGDRPGGAETIDCSGKFVMPGIINSHGHVGSTLDLEQGPKFYTKENVEKQLGVYASYGVTTVMSLGTDMDPVFEVRAEERATGRPKFARVYTAGRGFTLKGGNPPDQGMRYAVASPEEVAPIIEKLARQKVDMVKIWVDDNFGRGKKVPPEISSVIISEAKKRGLRTAVHIVDYQDARNVIDEGAYALAHSVRDREVDQALIDDIKKHNAWQIATLTRELST